MNCDALGADEEVVISDEGTCQVAHAKQRPEDPARPG